MFLGTYLLTFSGKGRLILPKKFRKELQKPEIILMKGIDFGIWGFSNSGWEKFSGKQLEIGLDDERGRNLRRHLFPNAEVCELDNQGRFVIPEFLLTEFKGKEVVILVGAGDHFELWNKKDWGGLVKEGD